MPAKGPLQSVQVFGRKVRPGRRGRAVSSSLPGRAAPGDLGRSGSRGLSSGPEPCGEAGARAAGGAAPLGQLHVSCSVGAGLAVSPASCGSGGRDSLF